MAHIKPFRYDALLRVRKRQEQIKAQVLAAVRRDIRATQAEREALAAEQVRVIHEGAPTTHTAFDAGTVHAHFQYERHLARLAVEKDAQLRELLRVEEQRRTELEEAMKHKRIVERLKERRRQAFLAELRKDEQKGMDEVAASRAIRERTAGFSA